MPFVFYDTETTGTNPVFDQILQFAAILTDDDLNPIDEINLRCRLLPWIVPSPGAMRVTGVTPEQLTDRDLPSHYQMMCALKEKLVSWSPAIFIGYNSMRFDEEFLRRAFWQTLHPPYLTVMNGNCRLDLLKLVQAASQLFPDALTIPAYESGRPSFRLDQLAPANGFTHENAHDALADVEATIHIARKLKAGATFLWEAVQQRAPKTQTRSVLEDDQPALIIEHFGQPSSWFGFNLGEDPTYGSGSLMARLDADWSGLSDLSDEDLLVRLSTTPRPLRRVAWNKAPIIFTQSEAAQEFGRQPNADELAAIELFGNNPGLVERVIRLNAEARPETLRPEHLEQMIFEGFPDRHDEALMTKFHKVDWSERAKLADAFNDVRFQTLARRLIYAEAPSALDPVRHAELTHAIAERMTTNTEDRNLWRSLDDAFADLKSEPAEAGALGSFLSHLRAKCERVLAG